MKEINDNDLNLIEDYISGKLSIDEEKKFMERLETDESLAKAYLFRTKMAQYWNEAELYEKTKRKVNEIITTDRRSKKINLSFLYIAASIIVLIGISFFILQYQKQGAIDKKLADMENDTSAGNVSSLSINKQPEKGSLYIVPPEYTNRDTLTIRRIKDFKGANKIYIKRSADSIIVKEYIIEPGTDSVLIPLKEMQPGNYQWVLDGTEFSGSFIIKEDIEINR